MVRLIVVLMLLTSHSGSSSAAGQKANQAQTFYAFSLKAAEKHLRETDSRETSFIAHIGHITRLVGLIVDPASGDCIIIGQRDPSLPPIQLNDLIVMLRSVFLYHDSNAPGVTIDPNGTNPQNGLQSVRYFAHIENTRVGLVCFEADYLMKRIGLGLEQPRVAGVRTYYDLTIKEMKRRGHQNTEILSRFWYYPIIARVVTIGNGVLLDRCELAVLTEVLNVSVDGQKPKDISDFCDQPADLFAESFSDYFDELAHTWPAVRDLRTMSSLAALARGLAKTDVRPDLDYWLKQYEVEKVITPSSVPVLRNAAIDVGFELYGGVHLQTLSIRLKEGDFSALGEAVVAAKPSKDAVCWFVLLTPEKDLYLPRGSSVPETDSAVEYFARAHYLFQAKKYDLAIACWRQVMRVYPDAGDIYYSIGLAFEYKGMPACAAEYYNAAMHMDPFVRNFNYEINSNCQQ